MRQLKARWTQELADELANIIEPEPNFDEIHLRDSSTHRFEVLCGATKMVARAVYDQTGGPRPTCTGCILVNLQNKAEAS